MTSVFVSVGGTDEPKHLDLTGHQETVGSGWTQDVHSRRGPQKKESVKKGATPPRTGGRKGWHLWRELCFCGEAGRESSLPTGDPPLHFATFSIKRFSFLAKKAAPSLLEPPPFSLAVCGLGHKLFRRPVHSYFKGLISFPVMSLYSLEPPFHFTELLFIPLIFF